MTMLYLLQMDVKRIHQEVFRNNQRMPQVDLDKGKLGDLILVEICAKMYYEDNYTIGTGLLIEWQFVLTAAHAIYSWEKRQRYDEIKLFFVDQGGKLSQVNAKEEIYVPYGYRTALNKDQSICQYDYGIIQLQEKKQCQTQKFRETSQTSQKGINGEFLKELNMIADKKNKVMLLGFAHKNSYGSYAIHNRNISGKLQSLSISQGDFSKGKILLRYDFNTTGGMSGGPLIQFINQKIQLIGLHVGSNQPQQAAILDFMHDSNKPGCNIGLSIRQVLRCIRRVLKNEFSYKRKILRFFEFPMLEKLIEIKKKQTRQNLLTKVLNQLELLEHKQMKKKLIDFIMREDWDETNLNRAIDNLKQMPKRFDNVEPIQLQAARPRNFSGQTEERPQKKPINERPSQKVEIQASLANFEQNFNETKRALRNPEVKGRIEQQKKCPCAIY